MDRESDVLKYRYLRLSNNQASGNERLVTLVQPSVNSDFNPHAFFVHFIEHSAELNQFVNTLQSYKDRIFPVLYGVKAGSNYLVEISDRICRVKVISICFQLCKCLLLDSGSEVTIDMHALFSVPKELNDVPPFAKQFALADFPNKLLNKDLLGELSFYFKYVAKKVLTLKIVSSSRDFFTEEVSASSTDVPLCQLYDGEFNVIHAYKHLCQQQLKYPKQIELEEDVDYKVAIHVFESPKDFFAQTQSTEFCDLVAILQNAKPPLFEDPKNNDPCIVQFKGCNMRAKIWNKVTAEIFQVCFVDFGFIDCFHAKEIKVSAQLFTQLPPLAYRCCLFRFEGNAKIYPDTLEAFKEVTRKSKEEPIILRVVAKKTRVHVVKLKNALGYEIISGESSQNMLDWTENRAAFDDYTMMENMSIWTHLTGETHSMEQSNWDVESICEDNQRIPTTHQLLEKRISNESNSSSGVSSGKSETGVSVAQMTGVVSITDFTLQVLTVQRMYNDFCEKLKSAAATQGYLKNFQNGTTCLAFHGIQKKWTRVTILDYDSNDFLVSVKCVDDGTTFSSQEPTHFKEIPSHLAMEPHFGINCSLPVVYEQDKESETTCMLMSLTNQDLNFHKITDFQQKCFVELYWRERIVVDMLVEMKLADRVVVVPSGPAFIVYVKSTKHFAVQMESDGFALNKVLNYCFRHYKKIEVKEPKIGMLVLAAWGGYWYRAIITDISLDKSSYNVYFIDFGHLAYARLIGAIGDPIIAEIPPIAYLCSLDIPSGKRVDARSEDMFRNVAKNGHSKVYLKMKRAEKKFAIVDIFLDEDCKDNVLAACHGLNVQTFPE